MTSLLLRPSSFAISCTRLLIRSPTLYHALELRGLRLVRRDAAEQRVRERHVCAPAAVGEDRAAAVHLGVRVGLPLLFLRVLVLRRLALGLYVYLPVRQLHGETGVLALAPDRQRELVVRHYDLGLLLVLVQVDLAHPRRAQGLGYEPRGLGVPLDGVDLLVPELGDDGPLAAPPRPYARPHGVPALLVRPARDLRAEPHLAGGGPDLNEPVVDLGHLEPEELPEKPLVAAADRKARA